MTEPLPRLPDEPMGLDVTRPLFDTLGNPHQVILSSMFQVLTTYRGLFFVWDKNNGESLMREQSDIRLTNDELPRGTSQAPVTDEDRRQMLQAATVIAYLRRSSSAELRARTKSPRGKAPPDP